MNDRRKDIKLYNVLFPFWAILLFPQTWWFVLPGNFVIDSLVLIISMWILKISEKKQWYKKHILKIFLLGLISDAIGSAYMLLMTMVFEVGRRGDEFYITLPALVISAILIFVFDYFITFREIENKTRLEMSLIFAVVTAPYAFLVPTSLLY